MLALNMRNIYKQKSDSFDSHFEQHFNSTTLRTDLRKYMAFKLVNKLNTIRAMKTIMKHSYNLSMEEHLTILKNLNNKRVTVMNKN